jgi:hypothetical protein
MPDTGETRQATAAVAAILARAGPDPHVTAGEIVQALTLRGWRHIPLQPPPRAVPAPPTGEYRRAREAITREDANAADG